MRGQGTQVNCSWVCFQCVHHSLGQSGRHIKGHQTRCPQSCTATVKCQKRLAFLLGE
jgi:hypothetical protein